MWRVLGAAVLALLVTSARAATDCGSVKVDHQSRLLEVGGTVFQMKAEKLGRNGWRLVGHDMVFVHSGKTNTLIRHGGSQHLTCHGDAADDALQGKQPVPYAANTLPASATAFETDDESAGAHPTTEAKGHHGGHGGHGGHGHGHGGKGK